jgi:hypothetical protein
MERYAAMLRVIASEQSEQDELKLDLDALVREGARRMLLMGVRDVVRCWEHKGETPDSWDAPQPSR